MSKSPPPKDEGGMNDLKKLLAKEELTVVEAAKVLGVSRPSIYTMIDRGVLTESSRHTLSWGKRVSTKSVVAIMKQLNRDIPSVAR